MTTNVSVGGTTEITVTTGAQNTFKTIATDSGNAITDNTIDILTISGANGLSTSANANTDTITIGASSGNVITTTSSVGDLSDVSVSGVTANQVLLWNDSNNQFEPGQVSSGAGYQTTDVLADLDDVTATGAYNSGEILVFTQTGENAWVNRPISGDATLSNTGNLQLVANSVGTTELDTANIDISDFSNITANVNVLNDSYIFNAHGNIGVGFFDSKLQLSKTELAGDLTFLNSSIDIGSTGTRVNNLYVNNLDASGTITGIDISDLTDTGGLLQADDLSDNTTDDLAEGSTNLYFSGKTTDDLTQGATNLYYADSLVDAHLSGGTGVTYTTGEIAIGQDVGTTADVTFNTVEATDELIGSMRGEMVFRAQAAVALTKGEAVYVSGLSGNTPIVDKARANSDSTMPAFGLAAENISSGGTGKITTFGSQTGLDVANFGETGITFGLGDTVYISATEAGKLTNVAPTGESNRIQNIGKIERSTPTTGMTIKVGGAGRTNATPALDSGNIFIGDGSNQAVTTNLNTQIDNRVANIAVSNIAADAVGVTELDTANIDISNFTDTGGLLAADDLSNNTTDDLAEGSTNLYFNGKTTTDLPEGTNEYYTDAKVQAISINNVVEDTTPELGGTLDILNNEIKSSNANVVISADSTDKDVIVKIKDAGGTLQTAATFRDATRIEEDPDASGTTTTVYEPIMDIPQGIRIGTTSANFSTSGNAADNSTSQWGTTGIVITNADKATWPQLDVISYGGNNPLLDGLGSGWNGGLATHYPNGAFNLKAANGTEGSESAILTGDNLGGFNWTGHDGSGMGGSGNRASVVLKAEANEDFSSSNDRGCKLVLEMMRTGQVSATNTRKDILDIDDTEAKIGNVSDNKYINVDSDNQELLLYDLRLDLGQQGRIRADTDVDIRLDPQGTGIVRMDTAVRLDNQGSDPSGVTDASHIYAKDDAGSSEVYVRDEAGNVTKISPHNEAGEWEYFSRNIKTGKTVRVNMEEMIRDIEQLTGKTYIRNE